MKTNSMILALVSALSFAGVAQAQEASSPTRGSVARLGATTLGADRAQTLTVGAGQLACVETTAARGSEILWHAQSDRAASPMMLARR